MKALSFSRSSLVVALAVTSSSLLFACGSSETTMTGGSGGTASSSSSSASGTGGGASSSSSSTSSSSTSASSSSGSSDTCTEANSVCVTFKIPDTLAGAPTQLAVTFFKSLPAMGPPDGIGLLQPMPMVTAGQELKVKMPGITLKGDYIIFAALFMPGGGTFSPTAGIDYDVATPMAVKLDGSPFTYPDTLVFELHQTGDGHGG